MVSSESSWPHKTRLSDLWLDPAHAIQVPTLTLCAPGAGALVGVGQINAGTTILAGLGQAFVDLLGAVRPMVASHTL